MTLPRWVAALAWHVACLALCSVVIVAGAPLWLTIRLSMPLLPRQFRAQARFFLVVGTYLAMFEWRILAGVVAVLCHDAGRSHDQDWYRMQYKVIRHRSLAAFFCSGLRAAGVPMKPPSVPPRLAPDRPVIVLARHAGFCNGQLVLYLLENILHRQAITVGKQILKADPGIAEMSRYERFHFFRWNKSGRAALLDTLASAARDAEPTDGLMLFPEGTNFTAARRQKAIEHLRLRGRSRQADDAEALSNLLPPIVRGVATVLTNAPATDVLIFGHTGLEDLLSWCDDPGPGSATDVVHTALWHIPAEDVPHDPAAIEQWLYQQWRTLDTWVATTRGIERLDTQVCGDHRPGLVEVVLPVRPGMRTGRP